MKYIALGVKGTPLRSYKEYPETITEDTDWFDYARSKGCGVGVYLDDSGIVVVDTDSEIVHGPVIREVFGWQKFQETCKSVGLAGVPRTLTVQTRTPGHFHFYFRQHPEYTLTRTSIHSQITACDIKVTGYVKHWACEGYKIARNEDMITLPEPLAKFLYRAPRSQGDAEVYSSGDREITSDFVDYSIEKLARTVNGSRNAALFKTAAMFRSAGVSDPLTKSRLATAARTAGLSVSEINRTLESAWGKR